MFFSELLGWTLKEIDAGEFGIYTIFQKDGQDVAGMMNQTSESPNKQSRLIPFKKGSDFVV